MCLYEKDWDDTFEVRKPVFSEEGAGQSQRLPKGSELMVVTVDEFLDALEELKGDLGGDAPLYELLLQFFPKICPTNFFEPFLEQLLQWESAAREYNTLPYDGGYLDQPLHVIQAFQIIREARGQYYALKERRAADKRKATNATRKSGKG